MKVSYLNLETIVNFNYVTSMFPSYFILNLYVLVHSAPMMVIIIGPRAILSVIVLFSKCSILIRIGDFDAGPIFNLAPEPMGPFFTVPRIFIGQNLLSCWEMYYGVNDLCVVSCVCHHMT